MQSCMMRKVAIQINTVAPNVELHVRVEYREIEIIGVMISVVYVGWCMCGKHMKNRVLYES